MPLYFTIYSRIVLLSLFSVLVYCEVSFSTSIRDQSTRTKCCLHGKIQMKCKTSRLAGSFVLFCIEIKLSAKVEGGFPRLWPSKCFRCEFRKWLKTASAGGTHLKLCPMQMRCNRQKRADWKYVFYTENVTARWRFQFRLHRSQTFGESRNNFPASSALFFFLLNGIFGGDENVLGDCYTKAGWATQNKVLKSI